MSQSRNMSPMGNLPVRWNLGAIERTVIPEADRDAGCEWMGGGGKPHCESGSSLRKTWKNHGGHERHESGRTMNIDK